MKELIISRDEPNETYISLQSLPFGDGLTLVKTNGSGEQRSKGGKLISAGGPKQTILASIPKSKRQALADFILNAD